MPEGTRLGEPLGEPQASRRGVGSRARGLKEQQPPPLQASQAVCPTGSPEQLQRAPSLNPDTPEHPNPQRPRQRQKYRGPPKMPPCTAGSHPGSPDCPSVVRGVASDRWRSQDFHPPFPTAPSLQCGFLPRGGGERPTGAGLVCPIQSPFISRETLSLNSSFQALAE